MKIQNLFAFSVPFSKLLKCKFSQSACIFGKDINGVILAANDKLLEINNLKNINNILGKSQEILAPAEIIASIVDNDKKTLQSKCIQLFLEKGQIKSTTLERHDFLSVKTQLFNSSGNVIGTAGFGFCLGKIALSDVLSAINEINIMPYSADNASTLTISRIQGLTKREKQCAILLTKGMRTKGIAGVLGVAPRTIEKHIENMKNKMHCCAQSQLIDKLLEEIDDKLF